VRSGPGLREAKRPPPRRGQCLGTLALAAGLLLRAASAAPPSDAPRRGGTLRLVGSDEFSTLDPAVSLNISYQALQRLMFRGLFDYDAQDHLVPEQASDWALSTDRRVYTFHLRPGVRFPSGREVEAEDYIFALERVINPRTASSGQSYFTGVRGAEEYAAGAAPRVAGLRAPDPRTLVIELTQPSVIFPFKLAMPYAFPVPREQVTSSVRAYREHLEGSGPYRVLDHQPGVRWRLGRNPRYRGADGFPDQVDLQIVRDRYLHTMMIECGDADLSLNQLTGLDATRLRRDPSLREAVRRVRMPAVDFIFMNTGVKPFDNRLVRRAVNFAVDRERLARLETTAVPARAVLPGVLALGGVEPPHYDYDPVRARGLLAGAGFANGFETELWYIRGFLGRVPESVQAQLAAVGIRATLHPVTADTLWDKAGARGQVPCGIWGWVVDFPDAASMFDPALNGAKNSDRDCNNVAFYSNPEVSTLLASADRVFDPASRAGLLRRVESIVMQDAPWAPLIHTEYAYLCAPRVRGFVPHPLWSYRIERIWLADGQ